MRILKAIRNLFPRKKLKTFNGKEMTPEQEEATNGFFEMPSVDFFRVISITEPSYGRIITFKYDMDDPKGKQLYEWMKVMTQFNGNGYADMKEIGENCITVEYVDYREAEQIRNAWMENMGDIQRLRDMIDQVK